MNIYRYDVHHPHKYDLPVMPDTHLFLKEICMSNATALLVIDVQHGLFVSSPPPAEATEVIERINTLTARARAHAVPVIFIRHEQSSDGLIPGSAPHALDARLHVTSGDLQIDKTTPDAFLRTPLGDKLDALKIKHLVICGYSTEFCVDSTVRRAAGLGYDVTLVADAHTAHDKPHASGEQIRRHHNATLPAISSFGVRITAIDSAAIVFHAGALLA